MEEKLIEIIAENLGVAYVVGIIAVGLLIFVIWWARGVYERVRRIDKLPCDDHSMKMEEQDRRREEMEKRVVRIDATLTYMQKSLDALVQSLQGGQKGTPDPFTQAHSPLSLTLLGEEMVLRTGMREMLQKRWEDIRRMVAEHSVSKNPYDIQQYCLEQAVVFPEKFLEPQDLDRLKTDAFQKGLTLTPYMRAVAVLVRDRYFEENGIDVKEVDASAPTSQEK